MKNKIPKHIALILDGNRTWAKENGKPAFAGHTKGAKNIRPIAEYAAEQGIKYLTLYILSTENLKNRSPVELNHLFKLFTKLSDGASFFQENNIRAQFIGNLKGLPSNIQTALTALKKNTEQNTGMVLTFAVNYGGRDEITRAAQRLSQQKLEITEDSLSKALDTSPTPEVDLVIRTGGYQRLSNFLLWQAAYAELFFSKTNWPAFTPTELAESLTWYEDQKRKRGK